MYKKVLFQTIQFSMSTQFSSIWPLDRTISGATTPGHSGPGSDGNEGVVRILQNSGITGTSPSDCFVSYPGHLLGEYHSSAEMQSVYSVAPNRLGQDQIDLFENYLYQIGIFGIN